MELLAGHGVSHALCTIPWVVENYLRIEAKKIANACSQPNMHCFLCSSKVSVILLCCDMYLNSHICTTWNQIFLIILTLVNCVTKISCRGFCCKLEQALQGAKKKVLQWGMTWGDFNISSPSFRQEFFSLMSSNYWTNEFHYNAYKFIASKFLWGLTFL